MGQRGAGPDRHRRGSWTGAGTVTAALQGGDLPSQLGEIVEEFQAVPERQRLELLLDFSRELPPLPARLAAEHDAMEPVAECQSPLFLLVEVDRPGDDASPVRLHFDAPAEAPTTRGFAAILYQG